jgi:hypothetical protein
MTTEFYNDERQLLPLPRGEGWGEGQTSSSIVSAVQIPRRAFLQHSIQRIPNHLRLAAQSSVRIAQHFNAQAREKLSALFIVGPRFGQGMPEPIKLDCQSSILAKEIDVVGTDGMLSAKFPPVETSVAQPTPHQLLGPSPFTPKDSRPCCACHTETLPIPRARGNTTKNQGGRKGEEKNKLSAPYFV